VAELVYLIAVTAKLLLVIVQAAILIHVVMSWFDPEGSSFVSVFTYYICEPFVIPARMILGPFQDYYGSPIDFSYMLTTVFLVIIESLLF